MSDETRNGRITEGFQVKTSIRRRLAAGKQRIDERLDKSNCQGCDRPTLRPANIQYELADRTRGMTYGGIGSMLLLGAATWGWA